MCPCDGEQPWSPLAFTGAGKQSPGKITGLGVGQTGVPLLAALSDFSGLDFLIYKIKKNNPRLGEGL